MFYNEVQVTIGHLRRDGITVTMGDFNAMMWLEKENGVVGEIISF